MHRLWQAQYSLKCGQSPVSLGEGRGLNKSPPAVLVQCIAKGLSEWQRVKCVVNACAIHERITEKLSTTESRQTIYTNM